MTEPESPLPDDSTSEEASYLEESVMDEDESLDAEDDALEDDDELEEEAFDEEEEDEEEFDDEEEDIGEEDLEENVVLEEDGDLEDEASLEEEEVLDEDEDEEYEVDDDEEYEVDDDEEYEEDLADESDPLEDSISSETTVDQEDTSAPTSDVAFQAPVSASPELPGRPELSGNTEFRGNPERWNAEDPNSCLIRRQSDDALVVNVTAGRISSLGMGCTVVSDAIRSAADSYLGDALATDETNAFSSEGHERLVTDIQELFEASDLDGWFTSVLLSSSADSAVEQAIILSRRQRPQKAYRTVALVGSDHGRSFLCRTASGCPDLQEGLGPLVAGFSHVPADDVKALDVVVDEQTAAVLVSPNLWNRGGQVLDVEYLRSVRRICDERNVLLISDESQVAFGTTGHPLAMTALAGIRPDLAILSAGLFGGLAGGITLVSDRVAERSQSEDVRHPLLANVASATISEIARRNLLASVENAAESFAVELAERASRFEFVRDIHAMGLSIGLETDLDSLSLVQAAKQSNVQLEAAGETAVRLQPPLVMTDDDRRLLLDAVEETLSSIQLATADLGI